MPELLRFATESGTNPFRHLSIKDLALRALRDRFIEGATAQELIDYFEAAYGRRIERSSLSPQLSRLKDEKRLQFEGKLWTLPKQEQIEPRARSGGGSSVEGQGGATPNPSVRTTT
jgi:hypothetical protein